MHIHTQHNKTSHQQKSCMAYKYETTEPGRARASAWQSAPDMVREGDGMIERIKAHSTNTHGAAEPAIPPRSHSAIINMASRYLDNSNLEVAPNYVGLCRSICRAKHRV